jgi:MFS family permease
MQTFTTKQKLSYLLSLPVIVAALGYFVDIYDLLLFGIVRVPSLQSLHLDPDLVGTTIMNYQMIGLLLGGIFWGVMGDKRGRLSVLFGSILVYSLANIACGYLVEIPIDNKAQLYAWLRFIAGLGLAGELGAGITLVAESLPKELRAIGTSIVAGFGLMGAVVAHFTVELAGPADTGWSLAYLIGGGMGLGLLLLRVGVLESGIYSHIKHESSISKGDFFQLFKTKKSTVKYLKCIAIGLPTWYCIGILAVMGNQFAPVFGIANFKPGEAIMWAYLGISIGDFASGFISQALHSRKKAILYMLAFTLVGVVLLLSGAATTEKSYYFFCAWLGLGTGYWAMFVTVAAEQFGTNIRSTVTSTVPNMVRGLLAVMLIGFDYFKADYGVIVSVIIIGIIAFGLSIYSTFTISETHQKDLDFVENI